MSTTQANGNPGGHDELDPSDVKVDIPSFPHYGGGTGGGGRDPGGVQARIASLMNIGTCDFSGMAVPCAMVGSLNQHINSLDSRGRDHWNGITTWTLQMTITVNGQTVMSSRARTRRAGFFAHKAGIFSRHFEGRMTQAGLDTWVDVTAREMRWDDQALSEGPGESVDSTGELAAIPTNPCFHVRASNLDYSRVRPYGAKKGPQSVRESAEDHIKRRHINPASPASQYVMPSWPAAAQQEVFNFVKAVNASTFSNPDRVTTQSLEGRILGYTSMKAIGGGVGYDVTAGSRNTSINTLYVEADCKTVNSSHPGPPRQQ